MDGMVCWADDKQGDDEKMGIKKCKFALER